MYFHQRTCTTHLKQPVCEYKLPTKSTKGKQINVYKKIQDDCNQYCYPITPMEKLPEVKSCRPLNYGQSTEAISNISWALYRQLTIGIPSTLIKLGDRKRRALTGWKIENARNCSSTVQSKSTPIPRPARATASITLVHPKAVRMILLPRLVACMPIQVVPKRATTSQAVRVRILAVHFYVKWCDVACRKVVWKMMELILRDLTLKNKYLCIYSNECVESTDSTLYSVLNESCVPRQKPKCESIHRCRRIIANRSTNLKNP